MRVFLGITGASGAVYAVRLLEEMRDLGAEAHVAITRWGNHVLEAEGFSLDEIKGLATEVYEADDIARGPASGTAGFSAFGVVPCSVSTLGKIASGIGDNLVTRAAQVALKERRPLVLLIRETPLSPVIIEAMLKVSLAGATVMPACPGFYHNPESITELVDFVVKRVLFALGFPVDIRELWEGE
ncbi:MAG: UbiX family flavin prenyltransferase [candidate division WOR-3 bacterium]